LAVIRVATVLVSPTIQLQATAPDVICVKPASIAAGPGAVVAGSRCLDPDYPDHLVAIWFPA
jgi:hypothetical protein